MKTVAVYAGAYPVLHISIYSFVFLTLSFLRAADLSDSKLNTDKGVKLETSPKIIDSKCFLEK